MEKVIVKIQRIETFGLTLKQLEQKIVKHHGYGDKALFAVFNDLRVYVGNDFWKKIAFDDFSVMRLVEKFFEERIVVDTKEEQFEKIDALLFILNQANELQERHGKPHVYEDFIAKLKEKLNELREELS